MKAEVTSRKKSKREQILTAATELFCSKGYAISMDAIANHANVSKQTVYSHFSSKDVLFETCIIEKCKNSGLDLDLTEDSRPAHLVLMDYGWRFQNMLLGDEAKATFQNAIRQSDSHPDLARIFLEQGPTRNAMLLAEYLEVQIDKGNLPYCEDTLGAAMQLLLMLQGKAVFWNNFGFCSGEDEQQRKGYVDSCIKVFLRGYGYPDNLLG